MVAIEVSLGDGEVGFDHFHLRKTERQFLKLGRFGC
jgi:hypothetical protein